MPVRSPVGIWSGVKVTDQKPWALAVVRSVWPFIVTLMVEPASARPSTGRPMACSRAFRMLSVPVPRRMSAALKSATMVSMAMLRSCGRVVLPCASVAVALMVAVWAAPCGRAAAGRVKFQVPPCVWLAGMVVVQPVSTTRRVTVAPGSTVPWTGRPVLRSVAFRTVASRRLSGVVPSCRSGAAKVKSPTCVSRVKLRVTSGVLRFPAASMA